MRFTKLKIRGFKGFSDPVELPIRKGLSGVVGPNGCGKSNLAEAFGWVMGENRPSVLRGGSMEDVIFSGTATRPAGSFAEVELEIDNSDGRAPAEISRAAQFGVTRKVERDGRSTFLINGREVRWRDVQLLFADSASGARSSALVRQGQITELINARPSARSGILEDAAGIGGLHQRRHEAELKLNATDQNLHRINDIIEQLQGHVDAVTRQARQAARYRKLGEQLRKAEALLQYLSWKLADRELLAAGTKSREITTESAELFRQASAADRQKADLESGLPPLRTSSASANAAVQRMRAEADLLGEKRANAQRVLETIRAQLRQIGEDTEREQALVRETEDKISQLADLQKTLAAGAEGFSARQAASERELTVVRQSLEELEGKLDAANRELAEIMSRRDAAERTKTQADGTLNSWKQRSEQALAAVEDGAARLANSTVLVKSADGTRSRAEREAETAESALAASELARQAAQADMAKARELLAEAESRLAVLNSEKAELSRLLTDDQSGQAQLLDRVAVKTGYEAAFGAALGDDLFAPELNGAAESGWKSLAPYQPDIPLPAGVMPLAEFVSTPGLLARRMSQTGLAPAGDLARIQPQLEPGQRIVSKDGDLCRWDGFVIVGGKTPTSAALRLKQRNRLEEINGALALAVEDADQARSEFNRLKSVNDNLSKADDQARAGRRAAEQALAFANRELSVAEADSSIAEMTLDSLRQASNRIGEEFSAAEQAARQAGADLFGLDDAEHASAATESIRVAVLAARSDMLEARSRKTELEREQAARTARLAGLPREIADWSSRRKSAGQRILTLTARAEEYESELVEAVAAPQQLLQRQAGLTEEMQAAEARRRQADDRLRQSEGEARQADAAAKELQQLAAQSLEAKGRADADAANAAARLQEAVERIGESLNCRPDELAARFELDLAVEPTLAAQEAEVARLRRSRDALGAVNLRAEQDIEELQAEKALIDGERQDLEEAVSDLRRTIAKLNNDGRKKLLLAFEEVNRNFERIFRHLFGGGYARLELVEGDDPLDTGLEILCRPPGKRFSNISLLSGGEQTLTALALIFAFFLTNPAPVCVLDEVDAPLDDQNVAMFCDMVEEIAKHTGTRFLIVTHHAITMARMDRLFGVTMQEKGVSQLVSVDLGEAERMAA